MSKIAVKVSIEANYIYHMLSVSKCGYDNEYGEKYKSFHNPGDLSILKENESLLTVCGGQHIGKLYFEVIVGRPAQGKNEVKKYYHDLYEVFRGEKNSSDCFEAAYLKKKYEKYAERIIAISAVMRDNYDRYAEHIWPEVRERIEAYGKAFQAYVEGMQFTEKAEKLVGVCLKKQFVPVLCEGLYCGAEAVDITDEQDIFGIERPIEDEFMFVAHEFIIYLLLKDKNAALKEYSGRLNFDTWEMTEELAEFYLEQIIGRTGFFEGRRKYIEFYREQYRKNSLLTAAELFGMALKKG